MPDGPGLPEVDDASISRTAGAEKGGTGMDFNSAEFARIKQDEMLRDAARRSRHAAPRNDRRRDWKQAFRRLPRA
jgi:hypothetical protein